MADVRVHRRWMAWASLAGTFGFAVLSEWRPGAGRAALMFAAVHAVQYVAHAAAGDGIDPGPSAAPLDRRPQSLREVTFTTPGRP